MLAKYVRERLAAYYQADVTTLTVLSAPKPIKLTSHSRARVRKYDYQPNT
jgi:hypothetical protein